MPEPINPSKRGTRSTPLNPMQKMVTPQEVTSYLTTTSQQQTLETVLRTALTKQRSQQTSGKEVQTETAKITLPPQFSKMVYEELSTFLGVIKQLQTQSLAPQQMHKLSEMSAQLTSMMSQKHFTAEEQDELITMIGNMEEIVKRLPENTQKMFWSTSLSSFEELKGKASDELTQLMRSLSNSPLAHTEKVRIALEMLASFKTDLMPPPLGKNLSGHDLSNILAALNTVRELFAALNPKLQKQTGDILKSWAHIKRKKNTSLPQELALFQIEEWIEFYAAETPPHKRSLQNLKSFLEKKLASYGGARLPFFDELTTEAAKVINRIQDDANVVKSSVPLFTQAASTLSPNLSFSETEGAHFLSSGLSNTSELATLPSALPTSRHNESVTHVQALRYLQTFFSKSASRAAHNAEESGVPTTSYRSLVGEHLEPMLQTEVRALQDLITLIHPHLPPKEQDIATSYLTQLSQMQSQRIDGRQLTLMLERLNEWITRNQSKEVQIAFRKREETMYATLAEQNSEAMKSFAASTRRFVTPMHSYLEAIGSMNQLASLEGVVRHQRELSSDQFSELVNALETSANVHHHLSDQSRDHLDAVTQAWSHISGNSESLGQHLGQYRLYHLTEQFLATTPESEHTTEALSHYLHHQLDQHHPGALWSEIQKEMATGVAELEKKISVKPDPHHFLYESQGKLYINPEWKSTKASLFLKEGLKGVPTDLERVHSNMLIHLMQEHTSLTRSYHNARQASHFGGLLNQALRSKTDGESLPDAFNNIILHHYMPQQEKELLQFAEMLEFLNMGASMTNTLLNDITGFGTANNDFDFNSWLHGPSSGNYNGTPSQAKNELSKEKSKCQNDINQAKQALKDANARENAIKNNPNLTPSQKTKMINQIEGYKGNLESALSHLKTLQGVLDKVKIGSVKGKPNEFTISGASAKQITDAENTVINGDPKAKYPGGLIQLQSKIQGDNSDYSNQSQSAQMQLQLTMTEIQQEWTVVSTALQIINQAYMTLAQGISQH